MLCRFSVSLQALALTDIYLLEKKSSRKGIEKILSFGLCEHLPQQPAYEAVLTGAVSATAKSTDRSKTPKPKKSHKTPISQKRRQIDTEEEDDDEDDDEEEDEEATATASDSDTPEGRHRVEVEQFVLDYLQLLRAQLYSTSRWAGFLPSELVQPESVFSAALRGLLTQANSSKGLKQFISGIELDKERKAQQLSTTPAWWGRVLVAVFTALLLLFVPIFLIAGYVANQAMGNLVQTYVLDEYSSAMYSWLAAAVTMSLAVGISLLGAKSLFTITYKLLGLSAPATGITASISALLPELELKTYLIAVKLFRLSPPLMTDIHQRQKKCTLQILLWQYRMIYSELTRQMCTDNLSFPIPVICTVIETCCLCYQNAMRIIQDTRDGCSGTTGNDNIRYSQYQQPLLANILLPGDVADVQQFLSLPVLSDSSSSSESSNSILLDRMSILSDLISGVNRPSEPLSMITYGPMEQPTQQRSSTSAQQKAMRQIKLRFSVGVRVECLVTDSWQQGEVVRLWYRKLDWQSDVFAPYQVLLDDGTLIFVPKDSDSVIRTPAAGVMKQKKENGQRIKKATASRRDAAEHNVEASSSLPIIKDFTRCKTVADVIHTMGYDCISCKSGDAKVELSYLVKK